MKNIKLLRLVLDISETSGAYYLFTIPFSKICNQTILSLFTPELKPIDNLKIIHTNESILNYLICLYKEIKYQKYDVIHAHTPHVGLLAIIASSFISKTNKSPKLFSVHYSFQHLRVRNQLFLIPIFIFSNRIIFCSKASFESFPLFYKKLVSKKYKVIYNGVNTNIKINRNYDSKKEKNFRLITVSRLEKFKNIEIVIEALAKINNEKLKLTIVGDGSARAYLEYKAEKFNQDKNIRFLGQIQRKKVHSILSNSDLFVSLSNSEGFPVAVLESLACRCPIILSDIKPHIDLANNNKIIHIVDINDLNKLVETILYHMNLSSLSRIKLGEECNQFVTENYSQSIMVEKYFKEYKTMRRNNV